MLKIEDMARTRNERKRYVKIKRTLEYKLREEKRRQLVGLLRQERYKMEVEKRTLKRVDKQLVVISKGQAQELMVQWLMIRQKNIYGDIHKVQKKKLSFLELKRKRERKANKAWRKEINNVVGVVQNAEVRQQWNEGLKVVTVKDIELFNPRIFIDVEEQKKK